MAQRNTIPVERLMAIQLRRFMRESTSQAMQEEFVRRVVAMRQRAQGRRLVISLHGFPDDVFILIQRRFRNACDFVRKQMDQPADLMIKYIRGESVRKVTNVLHQLGKKRILMRPKFILLVSPRVAPRSMRRIVNRQMRGAPVLVRATTAQAKKDLENLLRIVCRVARI